VRRALVWTTAVAVVVLAAPATGAGSATPPSAPPLCATFQATAGRLVAGYSMSSIAAAVRYQLNSPGLLPVGDAQVGTVAEADAPFARTNVDFGPIVDSLGAPFYPGDTAARLGSALGTFGLPASIAELLNEPALAESNFPPSPGFPTSATFLPPTGGAAAGSSSSSAGEHGGVATSTLASLSVSGVSRSGSATSSTASDAQQGCIDASASSTVGTIEIAGLVEIAGVSGFAAARSDGTVSTPAATFQLGRVTVAGLPAYIDQNGVHLASQQPVGAGVVQSVNSLLATTLASAHMVVKVISPRTSVRAGMAVADSGGLEVAVAQTVPQIGQPPVGTPAIPLHNIVEYGAASVTVNATNVPAPPAVTPIPGSTPPVTSGTASGSVSAPLVPGTATGEVGGVQAPQAAPGGQVFSAAPAAHAPPLGVPAPVGWILVGLFLSMVAVGPLLGYARWQLLGGRI
jgi:hypothetical protein